MLGREFKTPSMISLRTILGRLTGSGILYSYMKRGVKTDHVTRAGVTVSLVIAAFQP